MMIFVRGLGEFLTRGADISGFPDFIQPIGHGGLIACVYNGSKAEQR